MLLKMGVDVSKLEYHCRRALSIVNSLFVSLKLREAVVTSTYEGTHSPGSLHYQNRAFDLRLPEAGNTPITAKEVVVELKKVLGKDFDVLLESSHIHIEFDPK